MPTVRIAEHLLLESTTKSVESGTYDVICQFCTVKGMVVESEVLKAQNCAQKSLLRREEALLSPKSPELIFRHCATFLKIVNFAQGPHGLFVISIKEKHFQDQRVFFGSVKFFRIFIKQPFSIFERLSNFGDLSGTPTSDVLVLLDLREKLQI